MDLGLKDKVVVVTGASKGIGLATARLLLQEGAKVAICSVTESHLREAEQELSRLGAVYAEVVDMTPLPIMLWKSSAPSTAGSTTWARS